MKISDLMLSAIIRDLEATRFMNNKGEVISALTELQQLREERRWHLIEDLKIINEAVYEFICPQCENKASHLFYSACGEWENVESNYIYSTEKMKEQGYVKGRLLPMDLPEVE